MGAVGKVICILGKSRNSGVTRIVRAFFIPDGSGPEVHNEVSDRAMRWQRSDDFTSLYEYVSVTCVDAY